MNKLCVHDIFVSRIKIISGKDVDALSGVTKYVFMKIENIAAKPIKKVTAIALLCIATLCVCGALNLPACQAKVVLHHQRFGYNTCKVRDQYRKTLPFYLDWTVLFVCILSSNFYIWQ